MFEGAQGTMLDIDHGTYPFVTSSSATSGGAATGTGVPPTAITTVIGVTKAYCTRVGEGPFPTESHDAVGEALRKKGNEFGAVTGRPRRTGWLDLPLLRYSNMINGTSWLVVTKLDVLDELAEIPVCVSLQDRRQGDAADSGADLRLSRRSSRSTPGCRAGRRAPTASTSYDKLPEKAKTISGFRGEGIGREDRASSPPAPTASRPSSCRSSRDAGRDQR